MNNEIERLAALEVKTSRLEDSLLRLEERQLQDLSRAEITEMLRSRDLQIEQLRNDLREITARAEEQRQTELQSFPQWVGVVIALISLGLTILWK